jgi:hypothetical protein
MLGPAIRGAAMTTYRGMFSARASLIDARDHIGPHHLAIGKTRKLFEDDGVIHAFYSRGYAIAHTRLDADSFAVLDTDELAFPVAWGGGAFCIDRCGALVSLIFLHRNQHELCLADGAIANGHVVWNGWRPLLVSQKHQAAPWLELGPDGTSWAAVLDRDGDFRVAVIAPGETAKIGDLFEPGEKPWYHSCVQMTPVSKDRALAIGFRGEFPGRTELVYRTVDRDLSLGPSLSLAPCNVNDRLTFHFQAVGDAARGWAHIVYLDDRLSVSHALYKDGAWHVTKDVVPAASFAPQITIDQDGRAAVIAADYEGAIWHAAWSAKDGWSPARKLEGFVAPNVSPVFATTGYGTGGLIAAARATTGRVPWLYAVIGDEYRAHASLYAARLGDALALDAKMPLSATKDVGALHVEIRMAMLREADTKQAGRCWLVTIPAEAGRALKLALTGDAAGLKSHAFWCERDGTLRSDPAPVKATAHFHDAFSHGEHGTLHARLAIDTAVLNPGGAWVEFYSGGWSMDGGGALADIAPFAPETAARMALSPDRIARVFKRMV